MVKEWFEFTGKNHSEDIYKKLNKKEKEILENWKSKILANASEERAKEGLRELLRFRVIVGKPLDNLSCSETEHFSNQLKNCNFAGHTKNKILAYIRQFLKIQYKDYVERFDNFEYLKFIKEPGRKNEINGVLTNEEIKTLLKAEDSLFWKTFLILQWEGGLRTKEVRELKWKDIDIEGDGFTNINPHSRKNPDGTARYRQLPLKEATSYLRELRKQQNENKIESVWVFPSPLNSQNHISKSVNDWFRKLSMNALGRVINPYLLRHTRLTELNQLVKRNLLSKDLALQYAGHSEEMFDKTYNHISKDEIKNMLKKQIYDVEYIPEEKKHKLEKEIDELKKESELKEKEYSLMFSKIRKELETLKMKN